MNPELLVPLLITAVVAVAGWVVGHLFASARDRANKRRDLITQYLIEAYRRLENAAQRRTILQDLESAIADVQLFGTAHQVDMARSFAEELAARQHASLDALLADLRGDLREELRLEAVSTPIKHLRIEDEESSS